MTHVPLDELLPHRPPMVLIDEVESFDAEARRLAARVTIGENQMFFDGQGVPSWVAIEYMAQTAAALAGCYDRHVEPGRPPRPGLLLGTRRLDLALERFEAGKTYRIVAENAFSDSDAASFACRIEDEAGETVAAAHLNAYRPPDMEQFLKERMKE
ncbi:MAG: 3-hydroxylacyl-ACP dehydratase [Kiritimatiellae bacterium]|nr:3-hydroxylacyl-ACP dehydratase [Kiritimatiellia bacterium]